MDSTYLLQSRRTEYLKKFQKTTIPLFIAGIYSIYNTVKKNNKSKRLLLKEFQQSMVDVSRWSQDIITNEYVRFKKTCSVLDKLIRAIFDLDIVLKKDLCKNATDFIPYPSNFIHQCYLNIARSLWKQPFLIYDVNIDKLTVQQNKLKIEKIVSTCIQETFTQYLPLDIEHDDISNIDYVITPQSNQDLTVLETNTELSEDYGDNNDIIHNDDTDVVDHCVSACNDNFKKLNYEINSNLHEGLNVFHNKDDQDDCHHKDNHNQLYDINGTDNIATEDYVKIEHDEESSEIVDDNISDIMTNDNDSDDIVSSIEKEHQDQDYYVTQDKEFEESQVNQVQNEMNHDVDNGDDEQSSIVSEASDLYETKSFHSEEVGDIDSVKSEELFISRVETDDNVNQHYTDNEKTFNVQDPEEIKQIFIGGKTDYDQYREVSESETDEERHSSTLSDIKIVNIEDNKIRQSSRKDALLNIKKKVKSSMHHSKTRDNNSSKYERYGDKLRVERKNVSFF